MKKEVIYKGRVAGISFEPAKQNFEKFIERVEGPAAARDVHLRLEHEPKNPYDKNAIQVLVSVNNKHFFMIGHVKRPFNDRMLEIGLNKLKVEIGELNMFEGRPVGMDIVVTQVKE